MAWSGPLDEARRDAPTLELNNTGCLLGHLGHTIPHLSIKGKVHLGADVAGTEASEERTSGVIQRAVWPNKALCGLSFERVQAICHNRSGIL